MSDDSPSTDETAPVIVVDDSNSGSGGVLAGALAIAEEGLWRYDADAHRVIMNDRCRAMLGYDKAGPDTPEQWAALLHPNDAPRLRQEFATIGANPIAVTIEARVRHADGGYRWIRIRAAPSPLSGGSPGFLGTLLDISDRRLGEDVLERLVRQNAVILDAAAEAIVCVNGRGEITFGNPAAARLLLTSVPAMMGRRFCKYVVDCRGPDGEAHASNCPLATTSTLRRLGRHEARFLRTDSISIDVEFTSSCIAADGGPSEGHVIVFGDVSEKKASARRMAEARQKLARSEKLAALGTLVSGVGHELRTPMSYINNHLYLIQRNAEILMREHPEMTELGQELIKRTEGGMKGIRRMAAMLDDLRQTYRPEETTFDATDLRAVVSRAASLFRGAYDGPVQLVERLHDAGAIPVQAGRVQQVVINLLNNAAEAMPNGGTIELRLEPTDAGAALSVQDDGPGIEADKQDSIFKPFFTTKAEGSGLGLYLVKQIVERHLGTIRCISEVGAGTTFRVDFLRENAMAKRLPGADQELEPADVELAALTADVTTAAVQPTTAEDKTPKPSTSSRTSSPGDR